MTSRWVSVARGARRLTTLFVAVISTKRRDCSGLTRPSMTSETPHTMGSDAMRLTGRSCWRLDSVAAWRHCAVSNSLTAFVARRPPAVNRQTWKLTAWSRGGNPLQFIWAVCDACMRYYVDVIAAFTCAVVHVTSSRHLRCYNLFISSSSTLTDTGLKFQLIIILVLCKN